MQKVYTKFIFFKITLKNFKFKILIFCNTFIFLNSFKKSLAF